MRALLDPHIHPKPRRQRLLQPHPYAQTDHRGKRAVRDRRRDLHQNGLETAVQRPDVNVGQIHDGERAERERVLRVRDCGDEVCAVSVPCIVNDVEYRDGTVDLLLVNRLYRIVVAVGV